jgi:type I restriction enzyme S subunit
VDGFDRLGESMTGQNMKRLGDYIRPVDVRNRDLKVTRLLGVSITKEFMPSIANIVGTDLSAYKVVTKGQFAYGPVTSRNGDKISVALLDGYDDAIISQAYTVFEVVDKNALDPEYLMMWFRRPEFDRYARFHSHGSAREVFDWEEMCEVQVPVPAIEKQREIVAEYNTLATRIETNKKLIATLEQTAQTLYRHTFVDNIDPNNLPQGWRMGTVGEFCECNTDNASAKDLKGVIRYLDSGSVTENNFDNLQMLDSTCDEIPSRAKRKVKPNDIVYSTVRPNLRHYGLIKFDVENVVVSTAFAVIRSVNKNISNELVYMWLSDLKVVEALHCVAEMSKATYPSITPDDIMNVKIPIPEQFDFSELNNALEAIFNASYQYLLENQTLIKMQTLLLSKMGA